MKNVYSGKLYNFFPSSSKFYDAGKIILTLLCILKYYVMQVTSHVLVRPLGHILILLRNPLMLLLNVYFPYIKTRMLPFELINNLYHW